MTDEEVENLALEIHTSRSREAAAGHRQGAVPWVVLGETQRHFYRVEARGRLADDGGKPLGGNGAIA
jgi:hypothetical protein